MGFQQKTGSLSGSERLSLYIEGGGNKYVGTQQIADLATGTTSVLTDNVDGTYSHDDGNGTIVVIDTTADSNPIIDVGGYYTGSTVEDALQEIGTDLAAINDFTSVLTDNADGTYSHNDGNGTIVVIDTTADSNPIIDVGGFYTGTDVEAALQEIGTDLAAINDFQSILTDNADGTYSHNDGNGTIVIIDTNADSNPYDNTIVNLLTGTTVQEAIDDLANFISPHDDGNILWVSSEGNNATAEKGDMEKPYADPWAARDAAVSGDLIYVLDGQWSFGAVGSGSDFEGTLDEINLFNGFGDGETIYYHFGNGVELTKITNFADLAGGPQGLFYTVNSLTARVTGNLKVGFNSISTNNSNIIYCDNDDANLYFEFDEMKYRTFGIAFYRANSLTVKCNLVAPYSNSVAFLSFRERGTITGSTVNIYVNEYYGSSTDFSGLISTRCCGSKVIMQDVNIYCEFNNVYKEDIVLSSTQDLAYVFGLVHDSELIDSNFKIQCNNLQYRKSTGSIINPSGFYHTGDTQPAISLGSCLLSNSKVHINVDNCISDFPCIRMVSGTDSYVGNEASSILVTGNYTTNDTYCIILDELNAQGNSPNKYITFDGTFISKVKNVISDDRGTNALSPIIFKGLYKTEATSHPVVAIREPVAFDNARLIVADNTQEDIHTDNGTDLEIVILDTYSNTLITNSDIVEKVSPVVRDQSLNL